MQIPTADGIFIDTNVWVADHGPEDGPDVARQLHALLAVGDTRGKQIHDANIVATMLAHGIRTLLTDNVADFARWGHLIDVRAL